ncbi:MAG: hypothetical protein ABSG86_14585 [Thermoguttaceae bacterium]|jgi:hypothetical protein
MRASWNVARGVVLGLAVLAPLAGGCRSCDDRNGCCGPPTPPLGTLSDPIWRRQEIAGAASEFVVYQHEFELNDVHLNLGGEDHVKAIAARLHAGAALPVVVERGMTSVRADSQFKYPVHPSSELDLQRRDVVVRALVAMGIPDAEQRVLVAPAMAEGQTATEAARSYSHGLGRTGGYGAGAYGGTAPIGAGAAFSSPLGDAAPAAIAPNVNSME